MVQHLRDMVLTPEKAPSIPAEPTPKKAPASSPRPEDQCPTPSIFAPTMVDASPICAGPAKAPPVPKADTGSVMAAPAEDMASMMNQMVQVLQKQLNEQSIQNEKLQTLLQQQASEIAKLREERASSSRAASDVGSEVKGEAEALSQSESVASGATSFEAARQRVRRMVKVRADGSYGVPQHIVDTWNRQGKAREHLVRVFMDSGCDKETYEPDKS